MMIARPLAATAFGRTGLHVIAALAAVMFGAATHAHAQATRPARGEWAPQPPIDPKLPTVWVIGDSTVRNGHDFGENGQWGWGNPIASFFDLTKVNVQNAALGGTSSRTFWNNQWPDVLNGNAEKKLPGIKPGDYLIMQFGTNDSSPVNDAQRARGTIKGNGEVTEEVENMLTKKHEVVHTYGWYVRKFVTDAKAKGAKAVVVCSPIPRNTFTDGKVRRDTTYSVWAEEAAKQTGAEYVPLNALTAEQYEKLGPEKVDELFPATPEGGKKETLHPAWGGAVLNAQMVVGAIKTMEKCDLKNSLKAEFPTDLKNPSGKPR